MCIFYLFVAGYFYITQTTPEHNGSTQGQSYLVHKLFTHARA